jgi:hypothetical protein
MFFTKHNLDDYLREDEMGWACRPLESPRHIRENIEIDFRK